MEYIHILPKNKNDHNDTGGPGDCPCEPIIQFLKGFNDIRVLVHKGVRKSKIDVEMRFLAEIYREDGGFNA